MKYNNYTEEFKKKILREYYNTRNVALVAREYGIPESTVYSWIKKTKKYNAYKKNQTEKGLNINIDVEYYH